MKKASKILGIIGGLILFAVIVVYFVTDYFAWFPEAAIGVYLLIVAVCVRFSKKENVLFKILALTAAGFILMVCLASYGIIYLPQLAIGYIAAIYVFYSGKSGAVIKKAAHVSMALVIAGCCYFVPYLQYAAYVSIAISAVSIVLMYRRCMRTKKENK